MPRFLTEPDILGQPEVTPEQAAENRRLGRRPTRPRAAIRPRVPVGRTTWNEGIDAGRYPEPCGWLGRRRVWAESDIAALEERIASGDPALRTVPPQTAAARIAAARDARSRYAAERRFARDAADGPSPEVTELAEVREVLARPDDRA